MFALVEWIKNLFECKKNLKLYFAKFEKNGKLFNDYCLNWMLIFHSRLLNFFSLITQKTRQC